MKSFLLFFLLFIAFAANSQNKEITVEDIWKDYKFMAETLPDIVILKDSDYFCVAEPDSNNSEVINKYDFRNQQNHLQ